jgi:ABC-2 type transport system ATP-binding protein
MCHALLVEELVKRYGDVVAVDRLSFSVEQGEIFGLLGPNGAGKTTTLEVVEGLQRPDSGRVCVLGLDAATKSREIRARTGVQLQASSYYEYLTLQEILSLLGSFYPRRLPPTELLERVGLEDKARRRVRQLSGGEQQRFALAASLVNNPELVILDEPTTGLDPRSRRDLWELVRQVREAGATVIVTTHYMEEAEEMCDRVAIMDHGQLLACGSPRQLVNRIAASYAVKLVTAVPLTGEQLESLHLNGGMPPTVDGNAYLLRLDGSPAALQDLLDRVGQTGVALEHLEITPVTLEDVFIELTSN